MEGIFAVNKPVGPTSHDIVNKLRKITGIKKIGHAGTLDPLASGVLVVAIGRENTKKINEILKKEKEYVAGIKLGENSDTYDSEGKKEKIKVVKKPSLEEVEKSILKFMGKIKQIPPIFSAIKIKGKPAYKSARKGEKIKLEPRNVEIKEIKILKYAYPDLKIKVKTGPGVYIRSLAYDIGKELKTGGYIKTLERTRVGEFTLNKAISL